MPNTPLDTYHYITSFVFLDGYTIRFIFSDGTVQIIDFEALLHGPVFRPLRNAALFRQAWLNAETGTIEWPTGADFNPVVLHDWPEYQKSMEQAARRIMPEAIPV
ncbi:MAG: DUF2442 domain-containing protein [Caldilineaceae bacterium]|nr:DUF2442 domain-containing protein [Caldilineaceae bacterium]HRJ42139.1 DUF2442 domain-containing protein [Caldilineaceae bacterium]